jgi:predicted DNA binding CopG/RHH family protein
MKKKPIPKFKDEAEERSFWANADSTDYVDWSKAKAVTLPELRPTLKTISLRLPASLIAELKLLANKRDVPYQSLLKTFLADRVREELAQRPSAARESGSGHLSAAPPPRTSA